MNILLSQKLKFLTVKFLFFSFLYFSINSISANHLCGTCPTPGPPVCGQTGTECCVDHGCSCTGCPATVDECNQNPPPGCPCQLCYGGGTCTVVPPLAPALNSPANFAQIYGTSTTLTWTGTTDWGNGCGAGIGYKVYLSANQADITNRNQAAVVKTVTGHDANNSANWFYDFSISSPSDLNRPYYWAVEAYHQSFAVSSVRSFRFLDRSPTCSIYNVANVTGISGNTVSTGSSDTATVIPNQTVYLNIQASDPDNQEIGRSFTGGTCNMSSINLNPFNEVRFSLSKPAGSGNQSAKLIGTRTNGTINGYICGFTLTSDSSQTYNCSVNGSEYSTLQLQTNGNNTSVINVHSIGYFNSGAALDNQPVVNNKLVVDRINSGGNCSSDWQQRMDGNNITGLATSLNNCSDLQLPMPYKVPGANNTGGNTCQFTASATSVPGSVFQQTSNCSITPTLNIDNATQLTVNVYETEGDTCNTTGLSRITSGNMGLNYRYNNTNFTNNGSLGGNGVVFSGYPYGSTLSSLVASNLPSPDGEQYSALCQYQSGGGANLVGAVLSFVPNIPPFNLIGTQTVNLIYKKTVPQPGWIQTLQGDVYTLGLNMSAPTTPAPNFTKNLATSTVLSSSETTYSNNGVINADETRSGRVQNLDVSLDGAIESSTKLSDDFILNSTSGEIDFPIEGSENVTTFSNFNGLNTNNIYTATVTTFNNAISSGSFSGTYSFSGSTAYKVVPIFVKSSGSNDTINFTKQLKAPNNVTNRILIITDANINFDDELGINPGDPIAYNFDAGFVTSKNITLLGNGAAVASDKTLLIDGMLFAGGSINFERSLPNPAYPTLFISYDKKIISDLGQRVSASTDDLYKPLRSRKIQIENNRSTN